MNIKTSLLLTIENNISNIEAYQIKFNGKELKGTDTDELLSFIDIDYAATYGYSGLEGIILLKDGAWVERVKYDGIDFWSLIKRPVLNIKENK